MSTRIPTILLADDDPGARLLQTIALESGGFKVEAVADGEQALAAFDSVRPDCLVLDVVMPKLTGFDVCRAVRARAGGQHLPILILTSLDDLDSISTAYVAGATDFAQKGISPMLLVERIRFMLRAKELQDGLIESESRLAQAQAIARIGHWEFDSNGRTVAISPVALDIVGFDESRMRSVKAFDHFVHPDDRERFEAARIYSREHLTRISLDFRIVTQDGVERVVHLESEPAIKTPHYQRRYRVVTIQDITQLRRAEDHARLLAHFDSLTGLPNRAFLLEQLTLNLREAARLQAQVVLATIDLERFNRVNHSLGAVAGDELLKAIAQRLQSALTADSPHAAWIAPQFPVIVARTGADEFGVAVTVRKEAGHIANVPQYLSAVLHEPFKIQTGDATRQDIIVGATLGAAVFPHDAQEAPELMRLADAALHQAKQDARGAHLFYNAALQDHAVRRLSLESDLRRAIERDQLTLHYQPRVHARTLQPVGVEALLRWQHPERGMIAPSEFIPVAESLGLIIELGEWALFKACEQAAAFMRAGTPLRVAVNVSAVQLQRTAIATQVSNAIQRYHIDPALLEIEITEGVLIDRPEQARRALELLKQQDIRVALDDFGTGYSSLGYLRRLPIDYLKIDRSFIADLNGNDAAIVSTILTLAKGLRLGTIAEGVETDAQMRALSAAGCDELQGFYFAHPMAMDDLLRWLDAHKPVAQVGT